jgi:hypothetical protein
MVQEISCHEHELSVGIVNWNPVSVSPSTTLRPCSFKYKPNQPKHQLTKLLTSQSPTNLMLSSAPNSNRFRRYSVAKLLCQSTIADLQSGSVKWHGVSWRPGRWTPPRVLHAPRATWRLGQLPSAWRAPLRSPRHQPSIPSSSFPLVCKRERTEPPFPFLLRRARPWATPHHRPPELASSSASTPSTPWTYRNPRLDPRWAALSSSPPPRGRRSPPWDLTVVGVLRARLHLPLLAKRNHLAPVKLVPSPNRTMLLHRRRCAATGGHRPPRTVAGPLHPIPIHPTGTNQCARWRRARCRVRWAARALLRRARAHRSSRGVGSPVSVTDRGGPPSASRAQAGALSGPSARGKTLWAEFVSGPAQSSEVKMNFYYFDTDCCTSWKNRNLGF